MTVLEKIRDLFGLRGRDEAVPRDRGGAGGTDQKDA